MLRKMNYSNVVCYSYGVVGNAEAALSKEIADSLGFEWVFAEYSDEAWMREWRTRAAEEFRQLAAGHCSLPHIQDWLAIKILRERGAINQDGVIVPGHTGDFVAGSQIPDVVFTSDEHHETSLINAIFNDHMSNAPLSNAPGHRRLIEEIITQRVGLPFLGTAVSFANSYEKWNWQERQAKYIANSVRAYDFFQMDWWMPFWDLEFVVFWQNVPLILRRRRKWYIAAIGKIFLDQPFWEGRKVNAKNAGAPALWVRVSSRIASILPATLQNLLVSWQTILVLDSHNMRFGALVGRRRMRQMAREGLNIIGMYSRLFLLGKWGSEDAE
jgi:asparagine synthase (glutamine-hydrolysing)